MDLTYNGKELIRTMSWSELKRFVSRELEEGQTAYVVFIEEDEDEQPGNGRGKDKTR